MYFYMQRICYVVFILISFIFYILILCFDLNLDNGISLKWNNYQTHKYFINCLHLQQSSSHNLIKSNNNILLIWHYGYHISVVITFYPLSILFIILNPLYRITLLNKIKQPIITFIKIYDQNSIVLCIIILLTNIKELEIINIYQLITSLKQNQKVLIQAQMSIQTTKNHVNKFNTMDGCVSIWQLTPSLWDSVLEYLGDGELYSLMIVCTKKTNLSKNQQDAEAVSKDMLFRMCKLKLIFKKYFNFTDRTYYFSIFQNNFYIKHQSNRIKDIALSASFQLFQKFPNQFQQLINKCQSYVSEQNQQYFVNKLSKMFIDPYLPLPKLMRQTAACMVNSSLQQFLVQVSVDEQNFNLKDQIFQNIADNFASQQQNTLRKMLKHPEICHTLMYRPYSINKQNLTFFLIPNNNNHNFIVTLLAITNLYIQTTQKYLQTIYDDFQFFFELVMRYNLLNNTVIAIEENLGSIFAAYQAMYDEIFQGDNTNIKGQLWFWKATLAMWAQKIHQYSQKTNKIYVKLVNHFFNKSLQKKYPQIFSNIQISASYNNQQNHGLVQYLLQKDEHELRTVLKIYQQMLIDLSINQNLIHYCGHSNQQLGIAYVQAETILLQKQEQFLQNLSQNSYNYEQIQILRQYIQDRIKIFGEIIKPRTFKAIINIYQNKGINFSDERIKKSDQQIENYIKYLQRTNKLPKLTNEKFTISDSIMSKNKTAKNYQIQSEQETYEDSLQQNKQNKTYIVKKSKNCQRKKTIQTLDSQNQKQNSFQFYESDTENQDEDNKMQIEVK